MQLNGKILSRCNGQVLVADVGISSVYGGNCAALEIVGDRLTALYCGKNDEQVRVDVTPKAKTSGKSKSKSEGDL